MVANFHQLFRNDDGTFTDGEGLRLSLRDFANKEIAEDLSNESCSCDYYSFGTTVLVSSGRQTM